MIKIRFLLYYNFFQLQKEPEVWITHSHGSWIVLPILSKIAQDYSSAAKWVIFCDQHTSLNLPNLHHELSFYDPSEVIHITSNFLIENISDTKSYYIFEGNMDRPQIKRFGTYNNTSFCLFR